MNFINIELEELTDDIFGFTYRDETTGLPIDLTGYSAIAEVRPTFGDPSILLTLSTTNGKIALGGSTGSIDMKFSEMDTTPIQDGIPWTRAAYDLVIIDTSGNRKKVIKGFITLARSSSID